jgi:DNA-binding NarL/FixJ family response regulator
VSPVMAAHLRLLSLLPVRTIKAKPRPLPVPGGHDPEAISLLRKQILGLKATGMKNKDIANCLKVSGITVYRYLRTTKARP